MTVHPAQPGHHLNTKTAGIALAGAVLAVGAGYGVANLILDEAAPAPTEIGPIVGRDDDPGFDPNGFAGTDREERGLMHRR